MNWKNKTVLITGTNGFIGSNLAGILLEKEAKVAAMPRELLTDPFGMEELIKEINPDYIFHLAAYGNKAEQAYEIDEIFSANVIKTYNLLRACSNIDYKAFVNVSTSSVYGHKKYPFKEGMTLDPTTFYACTKAAGEYLALMYARVLEDNVINVRPFTVYGPGEKETGLIPNTIKSMHTGNPLKLVEEAVHDWVYVEDFVEGLLTVAENGDKLRGETVNIGGGKQRTNKEIVDTLLKVGKDTSMEFKIEKVEELTPQDDIKVWEADISKMKELGWKPKTKLSNGLKETHDYYIKYFEDKLDPVKDTLEKMGVEFKPTDPELWKSKIPNLNKE